MQSCVRDTRNREFTAAQLPPRSPRIASRAMTKTLMLLAAVAALALPAGAVAKQDPAEPATLAILGDTPYSAAQIANFPNDIQAINNDPAVSRVVHLGDIKS